MDIQGLEITVTIVDFLCSGTKEAADYDYMRSEKICRKMGCGGARDGGLVK